MFSSLSHPARRKILRLLADKPRNFSTILETLGISSSHLTYHLENLGELLVKLDDGRYKLSGLGDAAVCTMRGVEEPPETQKKSLKMPLTWKAIFAGLMIGVILLSAVAYAQHMSFNQLNSDYNQLSADYGQLSEGYATLEADFQDLEDENERLLSWGTSPSQVRAFLSDVVHLNMTKYVATLESNTVEYRSDLEGLVEEIFRYGLTYESSKVDVTLRFRDGSLSSYGLTAIEGAPYYSQLQPNKLIDVAKGIVSRYYSYSEASHLEAMVNLLDTVNGTEDSVTTSSNLKLVITNEGSEVKIEFMYTTGDIDFQAKEVVLIFDEDNFLSSLTDDWNLFRVGSTEVNISKEEAIAIAIETARNCTWTVDGEIINNFTLVEETAFAELYPHSREEAPLDLIPYWYVQIDLDRTYPGRVYRIDVGLWADTGEVSSCQPKNW